MAHRAIGTSLCRLPGIRSSRARRTTTAGNHIESPQTFEPGLKFTFGRVLIGERSPATGFFEAHWRVERFDYSSHEQKLLEAHVQSAKTSLAKDEGVKLHQFVAY